MSLFSSTPATRTILAAFLAFPASLALPAAAEAKTVIYVGGANRSLAESEEWARQFRLKHPGVKVIPLRGPNCVSWACARGDQRLLEAIANAVQANKDDEIEMIGHSSGSAPVERIAHDPNNRSKKIRVYNLDGFPPQRPPQGVTHPVICVSGLTRLRNGQVYSRAANFFEVQNQNCAGRHIIEFPELDTNSSNKWCLHNRMVSQNACSVVPALRNKLEIELGYFGSNGNTSSQQQQRPVQQQLGTPRQVPAQQAPAR